VVQRDELPQQAGGPNYNLDLIEKRDPEGREQVVRLAYSLMKTV